MMPFHGVGRPHFSGRTQGISTKAKDTIASLARGNEGHMVFAMPGRSDHFQLPVTPIERIAVMQIELDFCYTRGMHEERPIAPIAAEQRGELTWCDPRYRDLPVFLNPRGREIGLRSGWCTD